MIIPIKTSNGGYDIVLEHNALEKLNDFLNLKRKVMIVTDSGVPSVYSELAASQCEKAFVTVIKEGEASKNFENFKMLLSRMVEAGFTRGDCVMAVGGGVVGDLAGFVAASFMRGIDFYNIPTTVLSQVDSSIGGKVAVDFEGYKNLVGAFYPPKAVVIDPETLKTLPQRQISNGLAEAVKMAATFDEQLFSIFEKDDYLEKIDEIIERSLRIKKSVVEQDEKETSLRKVLNFGHTLGHAIEAQEKMNGLYHGECVALGMLPMCSDMVKERLVSVIKKLELPTDINLNIPEIIEALSHDKKKNGDNISAVYVEKIGSFEIRDIPFNEFAKQLEEVKN